ncbi:hypothetical protein [Bradyrhizobium erythrophlei]|jgi:hypothetical protein|nr:hypothetical protein [Bradyrhizobium erythrophlei]
MAFERVLRWALVIIAVTGLAAGIAARAATMRRRWPAPMLGSRSVPAAPA